MSKGTGLGDAFYVAGVDVSGDTQDLRRIGGGPDALTVTGINKSAVERLGGQIDGTVEFTSYFNSTGAHATLSTLPTTDVIACYLRGTTLGNRAAGIVAKQANYDPSRRPDGMLTFRCQLLANGYGVEWGRNLTAGTATETGAANGSAVDFGATQTLGMRAYLQVLDFTGTDATITIEDSANGSTGWAAVGSGAFTQVTGATTERIETGGTEQVQRYLRYAVTTSGGFSDMDFVVVVIQNETAVSL